MGKYTLINNEKLDNLIERDIELSKKEILKAFGKNVYSIVLIGGFGRGEGGVIKKGKEYYPKNNYDFLIVLKKIPFFKKKEFNLKLRKVKKILDSKLNVFFEGHIKSKNKIGKAKHIMIYQDIINSSKTIFGSGIKREISSKIKKPLKKIEALRIIRNRSILFLISKQNSHLNYEIDENQKKIWIAKAILGFGDAILILKKSYKTNYYDKMEKIQDLNFENFFKNEKDYNYFKKVHKKASLFRLKDKEFNEYKEYDKILNICKQIHLKSFQIYFNKKISWKKIINKSIISEFNLKYLIHSTKSNIIEKSFSFVSIEDQLITKLPLSLYFKGDYNKQIELYKKYIY